MVKILQDVQQPGKTWVVDAAVLREVDVSCPHSLIRINTIQHIEEGVDSFAVYGQLFAIVPALPEGLQGEGSELSARRLYFGQLLFSTFLPFFGITATMLT